ncbi:peptidase s8 s53, subtilisin kexin sedolisin [Trichoderma arundinaceum]|uniref:Peptidase s8 s53, subtilisin kexin sedolisin n=1 Tax=Trichoderma arundinaceum TaxID=490622 RepID=A0A395NRN4_TRIAR|nr:peptidase s8 s53, subtilisin kexin sedolisin [Trichoderma arundinaceum]
MSAIPNPANTHEQKALEVRDVDASLPVIENDLVPEMEPNTRTEEDRHMVSLREIVEKPEYEMDLYALKIYDGIQDGLRLEAIHDKRKRLCQIKGILEGYGNENAFDDCVRWRILTEAVDRCLLNAVEEAPVEAINTVIEWEVNENILIIDMMTEIAPYLAFETLNQSRRLQFHRCKLPDTHGKRRTRLWDRKTPFHLAAERGNYKAIGHMIRHGSTLSWNDSGQNRHDTLLNVLKHPVFPENRTTALSLAARAEGGGLGAIKALLSYDPEIAAPPDPTFGDAIDEGMAEVVNTFLQHDCLRELFVTPKYILQAISLCRAQVGEGGNQAQINIANSLLAYAVNSDVINAEVIEKIIQLDLKELWGTIRQVQTMLSSNQLLHLAVHHQSVNFVEIFLHEYPESGVQRWKDHYPLWYNNFAFIEANDRHQLTQNGPNKLKIRDMLVSATIKSRNLFTIRDILEIFHHSGVGEICLDLSGFKSTAYSMSDLFRGLMYQQDHTALLSYESTIKYADFPALALVAEEKKTLGSSVQTEHTEIFDVLNWLQSSKVVENIVELIVVDRLFNPHDEVRIGQYVKTFNVEVLNWKLLDMSISIFEDQSTRGNIRELYLYASGKRAVISHWLSEEGIRSLPNLTTLEIYVVQNLMTRENCKKTFEYIYTQFSELCEKINEARSLDDREELFVNVNIQEWDPTDEEKLPELEETSERVVPRLSQFTKRYYNYVQDLANFESRIHRPTRVAVIDNGVLGISPNAEGFWDLPNAQQPFDARRQKARHEHLSVRNTNGQWSNNKTLFSRIKEGQSFVDDGNRVSQWFLASDPHGTQMARLICSIDPCCDLYVARVSKGRSGIIPARVARVGYLPFMHCSHPVFVADFLHKAIRWAISREVDIISMSFAIRELTEELREACHRAAAHGIAMICSAHDEGSNLTHAYPADFYETMTITTCDEFGTVAPRSRHQNYDYAVYSQEVAVGVVPFLESDEYISGSSVATAIAAGLGSLVLSCDRLAQREEDSRGASRVELLKYHFQKWSRGKTSFFNRKDLLGLIDILTTVGISMLSSFCIKFLERRGFED